MTDKRIDILDGWRALSILLVLAGHWLPIGPKTWGLNGVVAATGMVLFFNLSGFLITRLLFSDPRVLNFLIRRVFRIVPLAWVAMLILMVWNGADFRTLLANLLFFSNLPPQHLFAGGEHLWSLCVEMQFYMGVALLVSLAGKRALYALPVIAIAVTLLRVWQGATISIVTWQRVDEILAGATVALLFNSPAASARIRKLPAITPLLILPIVFAAAHPATGPLNYLRPYLAAAAMGVSLFSAPEAMVRLFRSRAAVYVAATSYALYVVHAMLAASWLGSGEKLVKYAKRPLLIVLTFAIAHLSTFHFEARMIGLGKKLAIRWAGERRASPAG